MTTNTVYDCDWRGCTKKANTGDRNRVNIIITDHRRLSEYPTSGFDFCTEHGDQIIKFIKDRIDR